MTWSRRVLSLVPASVLGGLAFTSAAAAQEPPTFSADLELVTVDAVVLDGDGEPVSGLGPEDFELRDEGELREVLSFEAQDLAAEPAPLPRAARRVTTNVDARPGRVVAVFWDDPHLSPPFAERARRALRPWLTERLAKGDRVVVASAGGAWHVADGAPGGPALLRALEGLKGERRLAESPEYVSDYEAVAISDLNDRLMTGVVFRRFGARGVPGCSRRAAGLVNPTDLMGHPCPVLPRAREVALTARTRLEATLRAVAHLAEVLAIGRGRKPIVLVSEGFLQHPDSSREFAAVARAAQRANAVLSVLDPAGLRADAMFSAVTEGAPPPENAGQALASEVADQSGSEGLAHDTGGLVLRTNDLSAGLERIARESQASYLLGFAPAPGAEEGTFRRISVEVRRSGLKVRARRGYTVGGAAPRQAEEELRRTLDAPFDVPGHPLRVAAWVFDPRSPELSRVVIGVDVAFPPGRGDPGAEARTVDLVVEVQGGRRVWRQSREVAFAGGAGSGESGGAMGQLVLLEVELPAGTFRARAVVRGEDGRVSGAVAHDFEVPAAGAWHVSTPLLSPSLLVGAGGTTVPRPTTRREFEVGGTLHGQLSVYATPGEPGSVAERLSGSWSLRRQDAAGPGHSGLLFLAAVGEGAVGCRFSLPLAGLVAGEYELALRVRDDMAGRELEDVEALTLAPSSGDAASVATGGALPGSGEAAAGPVDPELARLLEVAGRYVVEYEESFSDLVAEETYTQRVRKAWARTQRRVTRADLVFVRLPGDFLWGSFRDVFEVDGQEVRDRDARLERLFLEPASSAIERAEQILRESAAYNIGPTVRTINLPTLPLAFLHPCNRHRFVFEKKGQRRIGRVLGQEVRFEEVARPTLVSRSEDDLPVKGRFWIDPDRGTVLRSEIRFLFRRTRATAWVATEYRPEAALAMWVPSEMREEYRDNPDLYPRLFDGASTDATARYSNFRRFGVTVDAEARLLDSEDP